MLLLVIEVNVVVGDVGEIFWSEVELRGVDLLAFGTLCREIEIDRQIARKVFMVLRNTVPLRLSQQVKQRLYRASLWRSPTAQ
jgi:hypothetical protein